MPLNPLLQRILISVAAGAATSGVVVTTAKRPHRLKKRKKKKGEKEKPVSLGAVALADAKLPEQRGLTAGEWKDAVVARGKSIASVFKKKENAPPAADVTNDGKTLKEPDEIDGRKVAKKGNKKRKGSKKKRRHQEPASLWDSAKQSFKDTVKETVREEVKQTSVGGAFEKLKSVSAKVKEGANAALESAQKAAKNVKLDEKLKDAKDVLSAAVAVAQGEGGEKKPPAPKAQIQDGTEEHSTEEHSTAGHPGDAPSSSAAESEAPAGEGLAPVSPGEPVDAAKVGEAANRVADSVGSWLQGANRHERRARVASSGDVVEAKDAPSPAPTSSTAPTTAPSSSTAPTTAPPDTVPAPDAPAASSSEEPVRGEVVDDGKDRAA